MSAEQPLKLPQNQQPTESQASQEDLEAHLYVQQEVDDGATGSPSGTTGSGSQKIGLRSVQDGEMIDTVTRDDKDEFDDGVSKTSLAVMGHEPWHLDESETASSSPGQSDPYDGLTYKEFLEQGGQTGQERRRRQAQEKAKAEENGQEGNGSSSSAEQTPATKDELLEAGLKKIGNAVNDRVKELMDGGMSKSDASAQAIDEFWGIKPFEDDDTKVDPGVPEPPKDPIDTPPEPPKDPEEPVPPDVFAPPEPPKDPIDTPPEPPEPREPRDRDDLLPELAKSSELLDAEAELEEARDEYARINSGRQGATFFTKAFSKRKFERARERYETIKAKTEALTTEFLKRKGYSPETIKKASSFGRLVEADKFLKRELAHNTDRISGQSPTKRKFYEWWNKQGDKLFSKGTLKKSLVMAAIGLPVGLAVGAVAGPILGGGLAGAAALGSIRAISRGIIGNRIRKGAASTVDLAQEQYNRRRAEMVAVTDALNMLGESLTAEMVDRQMVTYMTESKRGNDREAIRSILIAGAVGGLGGAVLGNMLHGTDGKGPWTCPKPPKLGLSGDEVAKGIYKGITSNGPEATRDFGALLDYASAHGISVGPMDKGLEAVIINQAHDMPTTVARRIPEIVGHVVAPQGGGVSHEWLLTGNNMQIITDMIRTGASNQAIEEALRTAATS